MDQGLVLICGTSDLYSRTKNIPFRQYAKIFGGDDDAWSALYAALHFHKTVYFRFQDARWYVAPGDRNAEDFLAASMHWGSVPLEDLTRPLLPAPPAVPRLGRSSELQEYRVTFELTPPLLCSTIVAARSATEAEADVADNMAHYVNELLETAENAWKSYVPNPTHFRWESTELVADD